MKKLHVLIVEDNKSDVYLTIEALNETDSIRKISIAYDGDDAIDMLAGLNGKDKLDYPDLIIVALYLQNRSSLDVLEYVKNANFLKHIPVMIYSDVKYEFDKNETYKKLANGFISKCTELDAFIKNISKTIEHFTINSTNSLN